MASGPALKLDDLNQLEQVDSLERVPRNLGFSLGRATDSLIFIRIQYVCYIKNVCAISTVSSTVLYLSVPEASVPQPHHTQIVLRAQVYEARSLEGKMVASTISVLSTHIHKKRGLSWGSHDLQNRYSSEIFLAHFARSEIPTAAPSINPFLGLRL